MTKRILSLLLAAMMVLGSIIVVSAAEDEIDYDVENAFAIDVLKDINVLQGYDEDDFALDAAIKRYEMSLFIARALTGKTKDTYWEGAKNETPFTDLDGFKYAGSTTWTYNHGIILGKDNKTFDPNGYITYQEAIAMILRAWADYFIKGGLAALNINDAIHYPWRHIELVEYLGLNENIDPETKYTDVLSRGAVAQLIFNLLTWEVGDAATYLNGKLKDGVKVDTTIAEDKFGLTLSDAEGVLVQIDDKEANAADAEEMASWLKNTIWAWQTVPGSETKVFKPVGSETLYDIAALTPDHFAEFEIEIEEDVYYNIVYYTRTEVEYNPFTGEAILGEDKETVVLSIEKVTVDDLVYTNAVGVTPEYTIQVVDTKKDNDGKVTHKAILSVTAGDVTYPVVGEDALKLVLFGKDAYTLAQLGGVDGPDDDKDIDGAGKDSVDGIVKELTPYYSELRVEDTDGDGEADTLTVVPYVFAAVYAEEVVKDKDGKDTKATTWKFSNYALVLKDKATATASGAWTWEKAITNADGNEANFAGTGATTTYVVKDTVKAIVEATTTTGTLGSYDVRDGKDNYITIGETTLKTTYKDLEGWAAGAAYHELATKAKQADLFAIYENKEVDDEDLADGQTKYLKAWVIDGVIVALAKVDVEGEEIEDKPVVKPDTVYTGIIDFVGTYTSVGNAPVNVKFPELPVSVSTLTIDSEMVKLIDGKYYLIVNAFVDGVYTINLPLFLADETDLVYTTGNTTQQYNTWLNAENTKVNNAFVALKTIANAGLAFYNTDALGNIIVSYETNDDGTYKDHHDVNEDTYFEFVSSTLVAAPDVEKNSDGSIKKYLNNVKDGIFYKMDTRCDDYIKYTLAAAGKVDDVNYETIEIKASTQWVFVELDANGVAVATKSAFGIPEYNSEFTSHANDKGYAVIKNGNQIVVFVDNLANVKNFNYSMHADADYALADSENTKLLDKGIRDGYLYFSTPNLFTGSDMEIIVEEDSALAVTLRNIAERKANGCYIVAVTKEKHELLELYTVESAAVNAIAQLTGDNALVIDQATNPNPVFSGVSTKAELENAIQTRFNLTLVGKLNMSTGNNLVYTVNNGKMVLHKGMPLFTANSDIYVFFTPADAKNPAKYVAFIYEQSTLGATEYANAFEDAIANGTPVIGLNANTAIALNITDLKEDTIINLNGYTLTGTITTGNDLRTLTINGNDYLDGQTWKRTELDLTVNVGTDKLVLNNISIKKVDAAAKADVTIKNSVVENVVADAEAKITIENATLDTIQGKNNGSTKLGALTLKNVTVAGGTDRALFTGTTGTVTISGSTLSGLYALNLYGSGTDNDKLVVTGTTLKSWTSFTGYKTASFENCVFESNVKPYLTTTLKNCDLTKATLDAGDDLTVTIILDGCKVGDKTIAALAADASDADKKAVEDILKTLVSADATDGSWDIGDAAHSKPSTLVVQVGKITFTFADGAKTVTQGKVAD